MYVGNSVVATADPKEPTRAHSPAVSSSRQRAAAYPRLLFFALVSSIQLISQTADIGPNVDILLGEVAQLVDRLQLLGARIRPRGFASVQNVRHPLVLNG